MKTVDEMKKLFPWEDGMDEISGFGGAYEQACRDMVYSGLAYLDSKPNATLEGHTYAHITGIFEADSKEAKELEDAVVAAVPDCSGAMHQAAMSHCFFIAKQGWKKYVEEMKKRG